MPETVTPQPEPSGGPHRCAKCNGPMIPAPNIQGLAYFGNKLLECKTCGETLAGPLLNFK